MKSEKLKYKKTQCPTFHSSLYTFHFDIPCFILVGGKSSRFGTEKEDKAELFYKLQYEKCKKVFKNVYFVAKYEKFKNYPFFIEKSKIYAPFFALEEILKKHKKIFVLSVDTPLVKENTLKKLLQKKAVACDNPLIGYYDYTMLKNFDKNTLRIFGINKKCLKVPKKELININKKEDLNFIPNKIRILLKH
ncbi:NTP transferase domain-containing protein [Caminibacter pacificus]